MALKLRNVRHFDSVLSVPSDGELAAYFMQRAKMNPGKVWDGILKPMLQSMDKKTRDEVLSNLGDYGNELGTSESIGKTEAIGLSFGGENQDEEEERDIGNGATTTQDNIACNSKGGKGMRTWRDQNTSTIDAMQKANTEFWKSK